MKQFKHIIPPNVTLGDKEMEDSVNQALNELARATNEAIDSLVRVIPQDIPLWAEGEEVRLQCNNIHHDNTQELAIRHHLGVKPKRYIILNRTVSSLVDGLGGAQWHDLLPSETPWTDQFAYFYATNDACTYNTTFKILLLP